MVDDLLSRLALTSANPYRYYAQPRLPRGPRFWRAVWLASFAGVLVGWPALNAYIERLFVPSPWYVVVLLVGGMWLAFPGVCVLWIATYYASAHPPQPTSWMGQGVRVAVLAGLGVAAGFAAGQVFELTSAWLLRWAWGWVILLGSPVGLGSAYRVAKAATASRD